jgi:hypothetical protein
MEDTIRVALARWRDRQPNMASESFRNNLAQEIALLLREKGSYIEFTDSEIDEQKARETWVCSICGENTADVEYDYVGSWLKVSEEKNDIHREPPYNSFVKNKEELEKSNDYVYSGDMKESRKKNWLQEKHEEKVFGHDQGGNYIPASEEVDGMYTDEEVKGWEEAVGYVEPDNDTDVELRDKIFEEQKHEFFENTQKQLYTEMTSEGLPEGGDSQAVKESHRLAEELVDSPTGYIYESPDGGETIYRRKVGESKKTKLTKKEWKKIKNEKK